MTGVVHIVLAMKPCEGNFAENALKYGVAGININASRIGSEKVETSVGAGFGGTSLYEGGQKEIVESEHEGRWPANVILGHSAECIRKGNRKIRGHRGYPNGPGGIWNREYQKEHQNAIGMMQTSTVSDDKPWKGHSDDDGKETVEDWACVDGCPVMMFPFSRGMAGGGIRKKRSHIIPSIQVNRESDNSHLCRGDDGTAARFFKQISEFEG